MFSFIKKCFECDDEIEDECDEVGDEIEDGEDDEIGGEIEKWTLKIF